MHAGMSAGTHLIGCKVDLITKAEIRYRGTVYQVDNTDATITLAKGVCLSRSILYSVWFGSIHLYHT